MPTFTQQQLIEVSIALFSAAGTPADKARIVAQLLTDANGAGHDSHGVIRIPQYMKSIEQGEIVPSAPVEEVRGTSITAVIDGHWGFGQVAMSRAVDVALEKAGAHGLAAVTVRGAGHIGRLGSYVDRIARQEIMALLFVNAVGVPAFRMAPWGGTEPRLATDPMAIGIPRSDGHPIVVDMTTTVVAEGKVRVLRNRGESAPDGWLLDPDGNPTNDPQLLYNLDRPGSILPLGGAAAGHKGYGLNVAMELLAGALSGTGCIGKGGPMGNGILLLALDVNQFSTLEEFYDESDRFVAHVKSSPPADGVEEVLLPGEIERRVLEQRTRDGIYVEEETWQQILDCGIKLGVQLDPSK